MTALNTTKPYISLFAFHTQSGEKAYVESTEFNIIGKVADVVFKPPQQFADIIEHIFQKHFQVDPKASLEKICVLDQYQEEQSIREKGKDVTRVLINYHIPPLKASIDDIDFKESYKLWISLTAKIGEICRQLFPNLKPEESTFNIHIGFKHYQDDHQLFPHLPLGPMNFMSSINMIPKCPFQHFSDKQVNYSIDKLKEINL